MESKSIRNTLPKLMRLSLLIFLLLVLPMNIFFQMILLHKNYERRTEEMFLQLEQLLQTNETDLKITEQLYKESCIRSAQILAYGTAHDKETISSVELARELAEVLGVDEIHYFTPQGKIFAGTHPEYYGLSFDSGEQMRFFRPMLQNRSLQLCQNITPNTAEGREMQYAAVWMKDGSGIVQIGMKPKHLLQEMEEKTLQNIISNMPFKIDGQLYVVDMHTKQLMGTTNGGGLDKKLRDECLTFFPSVSEKSFYKWIDGRIYCIYSQVYKDYLLIRSFPALKFLQDSLTSTMIMFVYLAVTAIISLSLVHWYTRKKLIDNLSAINNELERIGNGTLKSVRMRTGITELDNLSFYINKMIDSIRLNQNKLTYLMNRGNISIGIFEEETTYHRANVNKRLLDILELSQEGSLPSEEIVEQVKERLIETEKHKLDEVEHIFEYDLGGAEKKYLRIEKNTDEQNDIYYVTDMSLWWKGINQMKGLSESDELTGLYNRRGFYKKLDQLFASPDLNGYAAMIFIDADDLKDINDVNGHQVGDEYLKSMANHLKTAGGGNAVCSRLGGDEFCIYLHGFSNVADLEMAVSRICAERGKPFADAPGAYQRTLQFSMGTAFYPADALDYHALMRIADEYMYLEKKARKSKR